jgi:hypothetical protein
MAAAASSISLVAPIATRSAPVTDAKKAIEQRHFPLTKGKQPFNVLVVGDISVVDWVALLGWRRGGESRFWEDPAWPRVDRGVRRSGQKDSSAIGVDCRQSQIGATHLYEHAYGEQQGMLGGVYALAANHKISGDSGSTRPASVCTPHCAQVTARIPDSGPSRNARGQDTL